MRFTKVCFLLQSVLLAIVSASIAVHGNNTTLSSLFKKKPYHVYYNPFICNAGKDSHCSEAIKSLEATLLTRLTALENKFDQLMAAMNKPPGSSSEQLFVSCKDIYDKNKSQGNKAYFLQMGSTKVPVYCHMTSSGLGACGGGGWTLVMKIDGTKRTFHHDSKFWSNKSSFNLPGGKTGLDTQETKLPTYWNTHFSKICLGMRIGHQINFTVINKHANSLYLLIADGKYRATSLGRDTWKSLLGSQASLHPHCATREGFNSLTSKGRARIGILGFRKAYGRCYTYSDSRIGFGTAGSPDDSNTCGNKYGGLDLKAMGYILIQ